MFAHYYPHGQRPRAEIVGISPDTLPVGTPKNHVSHNRALWKARLFGNQYDRVTCAGAQIYLSARNTKPTIVSTKQKTRHEYLRITSAGCSVQDTP